MRFERLTLVSELSGNKLTRYFLNLIRAWTFYSSFSPTSGFAYRKSGSFRRNLYGL